MTTIAWDGHTLAADKRACSSGLCLKVRKIWRIGELLYGASGSADQAAEMFAWIERGRRPDDFPASQRDKDDYAPVLVIDGGRVLKYERTPFPIEFETVHHAIGSGRDFALAGMACGLTAAQAVGLAAQFDSGTGDGVDTLVLTGTPS